MKMNGNFLNQLEKAPAHGHSDAMMEPFRKLQRELTSHEETERFPQSDDARSGVLLKESERLHICLTELERGSADADDTERELMNPDFRDEVIRLLVGTHLRLLALTNEVFTGNGVVKNEIARTHRFVRLSAMLINVMSGAKVTRR